MYFNTSPSNINSLNHSEFTFIVFCQILSQFEDNEQSVLVRTCKLWEQSIISVLEKEWNENMNRLSGFFDEKKLKSIFLQTRLGTFTTLFDKKNEILKKTITVYFQILELPPIEKLNIQKGLNKENLSNSLIDRLISEEIPFYFIHDFLPGTKWEIAKRAKEQEQYFPSDESPASGKKIISNSELEGNPLKLEIKKFMALNSPCITENELTLLFTAFLSEKFKNFSWNVIEDLIEIDRNLNTRSRTILKNILIIFLKKIISQSHVKNLVQLDNLLNFVKNEDKPTLLEEFLLYAKRDLEIDKSAQAIDMNSLENIQEILKARKNDNISYHLCIYLIISEGDNQLLDIYNLIKSISEVFLKEDATKKLLQKLLERERGDEAFILIQKYSEKMSIYPSKQDRLFVFKMIESTFTFFMVQGDVEKAICIIELCEWEKGRITLYDRAIASSSFENIHFFINRYILKGSDYQVLEEKKWIFKSLEAKLNSLHLPEIAQQIQYHEGYYFDGFYDPLVILGDQLITDSELEMIILTHERKIKEALSENNLKEVLLLVNELDWTITGEFFEEFKKTAHTYVNQLNQEIDSEPLLNALLVNWKREDFQNLFNFFFQIFLSKGYLSKALDSANYLIDRDQRKIAFGLLFARKGLELEEANQLIEIVEELEDLNDRRQSLREFIGD